MILIYVVEAEHEGSLDAFPVARFTNEQEARKCFVHMLDKRLESLKLGLAFAEATRYRVRTYRVYETLEEEMALD